MSSEKIERAKRLLREKARVFGERSKDLAKSGKEKAIIVGRATAKGGRVVAREGSVVARGAGRELRKGIIELSQEARPSVRRALRSSPKLSSTKRKAPRRPLVKKRKTKKRFRRRTASNAFMDTSMLTSQRGF